MPTSRVGILDGQRPRNIEVRTLAVAELGPNGELVLKTVMCGVCGSDLHRFNGADHGPMILGHEVLGIVEQNPGGWRDARGDLLVSGDLVVPETRIPCHQCEYCRGVGSRPEKLLDYSHCPYQRGIGGIPYDEAPFLSGGWSDYLELPPGVIMHRIDPAMNPDLAVLLEPFSIGMKAVRIAGLTRDDTVVVLGPGPIGLLTVAAALEQGAGRVILVGAKGDDERLALGREIGADATINLSETDPIEEIKRLNRGWLASRSIDASGTISGFELSIDVLARGGVAVTVGGQSMDKKASISPSSLVVRQIDIRSSQLGANHYESCLATLASGRYPLEKLVTHRYDLPRIQEAMLTFEQRGPCIKPVIVFA